MTAREYFKMLRRQAAIIENKREALARLRRTSSLVTTQYGTERVQFSGNKDKLGDMMCEVITVEEELQALIQEHVRDKAYVMSIIEQLESSRVIDVLYKYYILDKSIKEIASSIRTTCGWVKKLKNRGLLEMDAILAQKST